MNIRRLHAIAIFLITILAAPFAAGMQIEDAWCEWKSDADFRSLSEYFTGRESSCDRAITRTDDKERAGMYVFLKLSECARTLPSEGSIELSTLSSDSKEPQTHTLAMPQNPPATRMLLVGATGDEWPGKGAGALAWRVRIYDAGGALIAEKKSYLWEL